MIAARYVFLCFLSITCIGAFLYYALILQGPHLLGWSTITGPNTWVANSNGNGESVNHNASETSSTQAEKFDPEVLLSAPRRSSALPNEAGDLAVYSVTIYSFESQVKTTEIRVLDLATSQSRLITNEEGISSPTWLEGNELLLLKEDGNYTKLQVGRADEVGSFYTAATVPAPVTDIRVKLLDNRRVAVALVAKAKPNGDFFKPQEQKKPRSTAKLYDHLFVRHWDTYVTPNRNAIWHGILSKEHGGKYSLGELTNVLKGSKLESPIPTFGGTDNFDLASTALIFVAKDPTLDPAVNTKSNFYLVKIVDGPTGLKYSAPVKAEVDGFEGASTSPAFSADGKKAAFLQMRENGYESDVNHVFLLDLAELDDIVEVEIGRSDKSPLDRSPGSIRFSSDSKSLLLTAQDLGKCILFKLALPEDPRKSLAIASPLTNGGHVSDYQALGPHASKLLLSSSSFTDNTYSILDISDDNPRLQVISSSSHFNLSQEQVFEIWFDGAADHRIHAWVIRPSGFDPGTKYPLAYLIHGGPQGSWEDEWSTRWNPAVFAEQGYVVVLPDPTGSTGYGQDFTDGIREQWGGRPYEDLVRGFEYVKSHLEYVDTERSVALGASYGGYMMAWMQGQPLGKEFKALVCHDGSFNLPALLASDEQYFPNHEFGGPPIESPSSWSKWSPHAHIANWTTPMLVIHNELDYRLPISEGVAMFNVLQERNISSRFLSFADENHWVLKEENSLVWHTVVLNWINFFVGLPPYKDEGSLGLVVQN